MELSISIFINAGDNWLPPIVDYVTDVRNSSVTPAQPLSQVSLSANKSPLFILDFPYADRVVSGNQRKRSHFSCLP